MSRLIELLERRTLLRDEEFCENVGTCCCDVGVYALVGISNGTLVDVQEATAKKTGKARRFILAALADT